MSVGVPLSKKISFKAFKDFCMTFLKSVKFSTAFGLDLGQLVIKLMHLSSITPDLGCQKL
jgi:hypothetical protein